ncbi:MAG: hypothetical protein LAN59_06580, partial [Acidobacteriia bacterium]|nr:hypothetical protein [Terriglobia bacterium]
MLEEKQTFTQEAATPRWVGIVVVGLAVVSVVALSAGWAASSRSRAVEQSLATQSQQFRQSQDILNQRLARAEDINAQLQGELSVVTDKMKLTQTEVNQARVQTKRIKEEDAKQLTDLQTNVNGVRSDLDATKNGLNMTRGEFGTLIAKNHDQIEELRRLGERDYYEFSISKKGQREKVGELMVELCSV